MAAADGASGRGAADIEADDALGLLRVRRAEAEVQPPSSPMVGSAGMARAAG